MREGRRRLRILVTTWRGWLLMAAVMAANMFVLRGFGSSWLPWLNFVVSVLLGVFGEELFAEKES